MVSNIQRREVIRLGIAVGVTGVAGCFGMSGSRNISRENSFRFDIDTTSGITVGDGSLWIAGDEGDGSFVLYEIDPDAEEISSEKTISTTYEYTSARGLAYVEDHIWVSDNPPGKIYQIDPASGSIQTELDTPGVFADGLTWDGETFWHANESEDDEVLVYHLDRSGEVIERVTPPDENATIKCIGWGDGSLWLVQERFLYETNPDSMEIQNEFESSDDENFLFRNSNGVALDGSVLWHKTSPPSPTETEIQKISI